MGRRTRSFNASPVVDKARVLAGAGIVVGVASTPDTMLALPPTVSMHTRCSIPHAGRV